MAILTAPADFQYASIPTGTYPSVIVACKPLDYTSNPDPFGNRGHWSLEFRWQVEGEYDEEGKPVELPHTIKFQTGDRPAKQGARVGHMPWLTEYTRAMGMPDIQAGQKVDTDTFLGKRALLTILEDVKDGGATRSKITGIGPVHGVRPRRPQKMLEATGDIKGIDGEEVPF